MVQEYFKKGIRENISIHQSSTGWYYAYKYNNGEKSYTNMYSNKEDLIDDLKLKKVNWYSKDVFIANAILAPDIA